MCEPSTMGWYRPDGTFDTLAYRMRYGIRNSKGEMVEINESNESVTDKFVEYDNLVS